GSGDGARCRDGSWFRLVGNVGLRLKDELGIAVLAELRLVEARDLDFRLDPDLHIALGDLEDQVRDAPRPDEADDHVDELGAELSGVTVDEQGLDRPGDAVPAGRGVRTGRGQADGGEGPHSPSAFNLDRAAPVA